jgi:hypothetical protein
VAAPSQMARSQAAARCPAASCRLMGISRGRHVMLAADPTAEE